MADTHRTIFGSHILGDMGPTAPSVVYWKSLYYFNLYRVALAVFFSTVALSGAKIGTFGATSPKLFLITSVAYGVFGLVSIITISYGRIGFNIQAQMQIFVDICVVTLLMHTSGGVHSGLGLLLIVSVAAAGVVLGGRMTIFFAAFATILVLAEHLGTGIVVYDKFSLSVQVGLLGTGLFATAFLFYAVVKRIGQTEALAKRQEIDLANLALVNQLIIERMDIGVIVTGNRGRVRVINESAKKLLRFAAKPEPDTPLRSVAPELAGELERWAREPKFTPYPLRGAGTAEVLTPRFAKLGESGTLIFLEDTSTKEQQAQQLKLAALGRLTAGIAHEIRNPLGAISHAGQLLAESEPADGEEHRLVRIISEQCRRINQLVENVMQLGRREYLARTPLAIQPWLREFVDYFAETRRIDRGAFYIGGEPITVCMDPNQLHQVVFNLCENALRHSGPYASSPLVDLRTGVNPDSGRPVLDVVDSGSGVAPETADKIFEPFYTSGAGGTGLGLYIARTLCEGNGGGLSYYPNPGGGSRFRITFARIEDCKDAPDE